MKKYTVFLLLGLLILSSCKSDEVDIVEITELIFINPFPNLTFVNPVDFQTPNDGSNRLFVVEKRGSIMVFENTELPQSTVFLDIINNVYSIAGEQGLLGLAFHPNYETNGYFYINYNPNPSTTRISRFQVSNTDPDLADPDSELILLSFSQPLLNHNGGQLAFGPDGYLYISSGDGGPSINGQDLSNLLGNILRIDVDNPDAGLNYGIPGDNPFVNDMNARDEIFAYGLRNPWRMSFDTVTNNLWAGDVGSAFFEEIDIIEMGANYGWDDYEGTLCRFPPCDNQNAIAPVFEYPHGPSTTAITGGYVYRGSINQDLFGKYIYGDFGMGQIWALDIDTVENELLFDTDMLISSFGTDNNNELYFLDFSGGSIFKFERQETDTLGVD